MQKSKIFLFPLMLAALCITACNSSDPTSKEPSYEPDSSLIEDSSLEDSSSEDKPSSKPSSSSSKVSSSSSKQSSSKASSSSSKASSSSAPKEKIEGANFSIYVPNDLSMMSSNCKKYVDDMKAQQDKLIKEKGANADYYLNDLYGESGVDMTKGIIAGDNGGYRPANIQNDYLDPVTAKWEDGEKAMKTKVLKSPLNHLMN